MLTQLAADPLRQFLLWEEEWRAADPRMPLSAVLATADHHGRPSARWVDVAYVDHGFVYFTNHASRKAADVAVNPVAALCFGWLDRGRQIRAEGPVVRLGEVESDSHFATLPRSLQLLAWSSDQSAEIDDRRVVRERFDLQRARFTGQEIPRPRHWGGYRLVPEEMEFWQRRADEIQDRVRYRRQDEGWRAVRIAP
ncbi:pyridoxine/pyridoxamine 5'-phosphate oxidase [Planobispora rosea]|uniref:Pyridoxamine 5'-phosphate oxidase n=1 Tax=Planobispora rosea TaxID=35762 RepID=A0A8J3WC84_PLARO|nr:pyridoxamine 5'-phosphate oxidase [Planobispora rosea]GGS61014.1 pyridoxine/pyridoxamine 5'-phosphate oxidase [Planobispora rosea]GIH83930.1 pyridoxine/pyridoxamine 5'-phosphate oxidase [Planobispora rosea]